jgi:starch synthase (maltosyl-transferring)
MKTGPRIYNLFPTLVGSVDRWSSHLPRVAAMGFDWIYVNPFHETGYSGSLYAVKDYYRLNPLFRGAATASDDEIIAGFMTAAEAAGLRVMMDLVVNHTARDSALTVENADWYRRDADGSIASPSATDPADPAKVTVWTDLAEFDYRERPERASLIAYFCAVIRHYVKLGVRGFRCDAAYKIPGDVWSTLIAAARDSEPQTVFAAETLGAPLEAVTQLRPAGFDYLFNSSKWWDFRASWLLDQYEQFRHIAPSIAFPESHDTPRLAAEFPGLSAAELEAEYRFRYLFAGFFSTGVMLPIGYEFGFDRPLDVVMTRPDHWQTPRFDISGFIAEVNALKAAIPALNEEGAERRLAPASDAVGLLRNAVAGPSAAVALLNPDTVKAASIDAGALLNELDGVVDVTPATAEKAVVEPGGRIVLQPLEMRVFINSPNGVAEPRSPNGVAEPRSPNGVAEPRPQADRRTAVPPVVIEAVAPEIDGGRHPIKRVVGDRLEVQADIFREGHDAIAAVLKYRERKAAVWRETAMEHFDNDRWRGSFALERNTRYVYTIEAWPDDFSTWRHAVEKKHAAGQSLTVELQEGKALVEAAVARAQPEERIGLEAMLREIGGSEAGDLGADAAALRVLFGDTLARLMAAAPDRSLATTYDRELAITVDRKAAQLGAWYEFFPRSQGTVPGVHATFAQAARRLADIAAMGFDVLYLPPIHPIGFAFRKGRNNSLMPAPSDPGSPWAIGNVNGGHTAVEPSLGTIDDFDQFVRAANAQGLEIALDYALQCSPDHPYVRDHPEWFSFRPDGTIKYAENPPKKYQDIVNFHWYGPHARALWNELRDVVEFWITHGVRIFRVDNPHTKPFAFWEWMIGDVQSRHPEVVFLAEAFTRPKVMKELAKIGFTQSYTYFTWRNFKAELTDYLNELAYSEMAEYYRPNFFTNTPDILPPFLQTGGRPAFRIRLFLAATLSSVYGIYSGFELCENGALPEREEYADSEKYEIKVRDWDAPGNIKGDIALINRIRRENPALHTWRNIRFHESSDESVLFYSKSAAANTLLIAVNLDPFQAIETRLHVPLADFGYAAGDAVACEELLSGERHLWHGAVQTVRLDPVRNPALIWRVDQRFQVDYRSPSD